MMDDKVARLKTPEECSIFIENVEASHPELASQARRRGVELRASAGGAANDAEREALEAIYAVEEVMSQRNGKKTRASRTWQSIKTHGILPTVERVVSRNKPTDAYAALVSMGLDDFTFEAVVLRHQAHFAAETVAMARKRLDELKSNGCSAPSLGKT